MSLDITGPYLACPLDDSAVYWTTKDWSHKFMLQYPLECLSARHQDKTKPQSCLTTDGVNPSAVFILNALLKIRSPNISDGLW